jgi:hypothetical protein
MSRLILLAMGFLLIVDAEAAKPDSVHRSSVEACPAPEQYCPDVDQDDFGDTEFCILTCEPPYDFSPSLGGDCNNDFAAINPNGVEICNGLDDDCDLGVDEGNPGGGAACNSGFPGVCSSGMRNCTGGALVCQPLIQPGSQVEVCDTQDNDCDGISDEGNPGGGVACSTPFPGVCAIGATQCASGSLVCQPTVTPGSQVEICDARDNDCDGQTDEGNPGGGGACSTGLPGQCATGTLQCSSGALVCAPPPGC